MTLLDSIINYLDKISKLPETYCRAHIITLLDLLRGEELTKTQISYFGLEEVAKSMENSRFEKLYQFLKNTSDEKLKEKIQEVVGLVIFQNSFEVLDVSLREGIMKIDEDTFFKYFEDYIGTETSNLILGEEDNE